MPYTRSAPRSSGRASITVPAVNARSGVSWLSTFRCAASSTLFIDTRASAASARSRGSRSPYATGTRCRPPGSAPPSPQPAGTVNVGWSATTERQYAASSSSASD